MKRFLTAVFLCLAVSAAGQNMTLKPGATIKFQDADASHAVGIKGPGAVSSNIDFTLPSVDGAAGEVLTTDGSGGWYWSAGGGGGGGVSDGDKGDVIVSSSATVWTLDTGVVGLSQLGLLDPNVDRILFWDDSAGALTHLTLGTGLSITGTTLNSQAVTDGDKGDITVSGSGTVWGIDSGAVGVTEMGLVDPNADRIFFWDDSAGSFSFLTLSTGLSITGTNLIMSLTGDDLTLFDSAADNNLTISVTNDLPGNQTLTLTVPEEALNVIFGAATGQSITVAGVDEANAWSDGAKQTFNPNASNAGINVGGHTADPLSLANGDIWYNSNTNELKARINGSSVALGAGGGSGNVTKVGTPVNNQVGVWTGDGTLEGDAALTFDTTTDTLSVTNLTVTDLNTTNLNAGALLFEGPTVDTNQGMITTQDPTADRIWTIIDQDGYFMLSEGGPIGSNRVPFADATGRFTSDSLFNYNTGTDTLSVVNLTLGTAGVITFQEGSRQTFNPDATNAGINVGQQAGDPSSPQNGDLWYDSTANELTARINGANVALGAGGPGGSVATDTIWAAKGDIAAATGNDAAAILPVGTNGHVLAADSSTATGLKWVPPGGDLNTLTTYRQNPPIVWEEWYNVFSGTGRYGDFGFIGTQTGSGASATVTQVSGDLTTPGILDLFTGTTTTGASTFISGGSGTTGAGINFGGGTYTFETRVLVPNLSDGTESYTVRLGFVDATAAESTDGVYFRYNQSNANWQTVCILNGLSTGTDEAVSSTVSANTWYKLRIVVSPTTALFYVNDTLVNTETANIPITTARSTSIGGGIVKSAGTTGRDLYMDYIGLQVSLTSAR